MVISRRLGSAHTRITASRANIGNGKHTNSISSMLTKLFSTLHYVT